jgi:ABC-2 type transport system permease protein
MPLATVPLYAVTFLAIVRQAGLELVVGLGWLALALVTFDRLAESGRKDGSIEFGN